MDAIKYLFKKGTQVGEAGLVEDITRRPIVPQAYLKHGVQEDVEAQAYLKHGVQEDVEAQAYLKHGVQEDVEAQAYLKHGVQEDVEVEDARIELKEREIVVTTPRGDAATYLRCGDRMA